MKEAIIVALVSALLGSCGLTGLLFYFLRRWLDKRFASAERIAEDRKKKAMDRRIVSDELHHAYGRVLFWIVRFINTGEHNGELKAAFDELTKAEDHKKELDRDIIAAAEQDN